MNVIQHPVCHCKSDWALFPSPNKHKNIRNHPLSFEKSPVSPKQKKLEIEKTMIKHQEQIYDC